MDRLITTNSKAATEGVISLEENSFVNQSVIIEDRKKLTLSGVKDVISFDDETIVLDTAFGKATVKGNGLRISGFNTDTGDFEANGRIHAFVYMSDAGTRGGVWSRLFR